ncbi:TPA: restriction endonuclease subunit S [Vibrio cholerae]
MKLVEIGKLCKLQNGKAFKPTEWSDKGLPIVRIQNLNNEEKPFNYCDFDVDKKFHIDSGDLLFSWSGTPGTSFGAFFWHRGPAILNQHIFNVLIDESLVRKDYFRLAMNAKLDEIIAQAHGGVGLQHITKGKLEAVKIPLPPLETQKKIAAVLEKADQLRKDCKLLEQELNSLAQSVFIDMFGDPVTNPKGWEIVTIGDLLLSANYGTSEKASTEKKKYPVLRMNNITYEGNWDFSSLKYMDMSEDDEDKYLVESGDILFNRTNSKELVGKTAVYREATPMAYAGYLVRARCNELAHPEYISSFMNSRFTKKTLQSMCKSIVGMANINAKEFQKISVAKPPIELQQEFARRVEAIRAEVEATKQQGYEYDHLFNSLMQKAFKGELTL